MNNEVSSHRSIWAIGFDCLVKILVTLIVMACPLCRAERIEADLLIVGGTESGCAAAIQAARMGVPKIVLVNDIQWVGGQFSAEGLGAIDENRAHGYDGSVPIPRSGIFLEVIQAIEAENAKRYGGVRRPGNTRVITTARPVVSEQVFRSLLAPYEKNGQIRRYSNYHVNQVALQDNRVVGVAFVSPTLPPLDVRAKLTIDASDWGDVIQGAGAKWDGGLDTKSEYDEPSAPASGPATDMNPITWCMILEQRQEKSLLKRPVGYDPRYFNQTWGWIDEEFAYTSRRLVDGSGIAAIEHPDVLLINSPPIDYPLDVYPASVAAALEANEASASKKNIIGMTPQQREIVFRDARAHTLKYLYHLQQRFPKFQPMVLSDEFGTPDQLPPKPYIRESLRLVALHVVREQEVLGFAGRSSYATTMFPDAVFSWQFELDFHPTHRSWTTDDGASGPWEAAFRGNRRFGRGGTGRCVFPLRALIPRDTRGLLGAQKSLGYTSIVGSSCRLHDQSIHAGQASGAVAAVAIKHGDDPHLFYQRHERIAEIWVGLLEPTDGAPLVIWPFSDVQPSDPGFAAIQHLALRRVLGLGPTDTRFEPDELASEDWLQKVLNAIAAAGYQTNELNSKPSVNTKMSRRDAAIAIWKNIAAQPTPKFTPKHLDDFDGDGILNANDALPFRPGSVSWKRSPARDGVPDLPQPFPPRTLAFNFSSKNGPNAPGFVKDFGQQFDRERGFGWKQDLTQNIRVRNVDSEPLRDGFVFTRKQDIWECVVENGPWIVRACFGDSAHAQPGQHVQIESQSMRNIETTAGEFQEVTSHVTVRDGRLTLTLGLKQGGSNTCINWVILTPGDEGK